MKSDDAAPLEDHLSLLLAAWDDALAAGKSTPAVAEEEVPPELRPHLERDVAWCRMVRRLLPGPGSTPLPPQVAAGAEPPPALTRLGRFHIRRELGRGGFGVVFLAYDPELGREVALKVPRPEGLVLPELRARFQQEARAAAALDHPNLVPVYDAGEHGGICYIASAYCPGITLSRWLKESTAPVPFDPAARLVATLAEAVEHAHRRGILHRDLKPANILLQIADCRLQIADCPDKAAICNLQSAIPKITDFGLAKLMEGQTAGTRPDYHTQSGAVVGTPSYMAPEQARGDSKGIGPSTDVYALGGILYELLTGRPPFRADSPVETLLLVRTAEPLAPSKLRPHLPRDLETICLKCLHKEPHKRYTSAQALADDLHRYLSQRPIQARPVGTPERLWRWARRNPRDALWITAVLVLLAGGLTVALTLLRLAEVRQAAADQAVRQALGQAELLSEQARANPLEPGRCREALTAARQAGELAHTGGASAALGRQAEELIARLTEEEQAASKDRRLLTRLLEVRQPREGPSYVRDGEGRLIAVASPSADEQFAAAFREWGLDVDAVATAEAAARLQTRPAPIVAEVVAALDHWAAERRQRLSAPAALASALDDVSSSRRRELRRILARDRLPWERALAHLSAGLRPVPVPALMSLGQDSTRLRELAAATDPVREPVLGLVSLTQALRAAGDDLLAERLLRAAAQARPQEVVLCHTLAQFLAERQPPRWPEAIAYYTAARALRPELGVSLAEALVHAGHPDEGLPLFDRLAGEPSASPYVHFRHGYVLKEVGDMKGAIAAYRRTVALDPTYVAAHNNLGVALHAQKQWHSAVQAYNKAIALAPEQARFRYNLGAALHADRDLQGAVAAYTQALRLDAADAWGYNNLGNVLLALNDVNGALANLHKAVALDPSDAQIHFNLGIALRRQRDLKGAVAAFRKAAALEPAFALAYFDLGATQGMQADWKGAILSLRKAVALDPGHGKAHDNLGLALYAVGNFAEAAAAFRQAVALDPTHARAYHNLGLALYCQGSAAEAVTAFRQAVALLPGDSQAHMGLGLSLQATADVAGAVAAFRRASALDPRDARAQNNLGIALANNGDREGAIAAYRRSIALDPRDALPRINLGMALSDSGDLQGAAATFRAALQTLSPRDPHRRRIEQLLQECERKLDARQAKKF